MFEIEPIALVTRYNWQQFSFLFFSFFNCHHRQLHTNAHTVQATYIIIEPAPQAEALVLQAPLDCHRL